MRVIRSYVIALAGLGVLAACDDDPSRPVLNFAVSGCPSVTAVDAPIRIAFTGPVAPGTISGGNIIVTNAATGVEIPGALNLEAATNTVVFSPASPLDYNTRIRVRVNNVLRDTTNQAASLFVCDFLTPQPPITELFWRQLAPPTGDVLVSATLPDATTGIVTAERVSLFKRQGTGEFGVIFEQPYYSASFDADFVTSQRGYGAHYDFRVNRGVISQTLNGGISFDTVFSMDQAVTRLYFEEYSGTRFGVIGGGTAANGRFVKYTSPTNSFAIVQNFPTTGAVLDIDFESDTMRTGAATTDGTRIGTFFRAGSVFFSDNRGNSWTEITAARAGSPGVVSALDYTGVSVRNNNDIWVTGTNGYVLRFTRTGVGTYTFQRVLTNLMTNPDSTNQDALIYGDVEFAPDNANKGWIVGAQQIGVVNGTPRYQGFIFETRDGGTTWIRQGVAGADAFGAAMPRLRRIVARTSNHVWIVGDGGFVIDYAGINP